MDDHILWIAPGMSTEDREQAIAVGVSGIIRDLLQSSSGGSPRLLPVHELPPS
jgi:hypothetical protein